MIGDTLFHLLGMPFTLIAAHAVADFPLQGQFIADFKNPKHAPGSEIKWWWIMFMHAMIHGSFVYLFTGSLCLGCLELIAHFVIDYTRCLGYLSFMEDQCAHVICKFLWCALMATWQGII